MTKEIKVRCGHCGEMHYIENDGFAEIVCCRCGAMGALGELDLSFIYDALENMYSLEEIDFDDSTDRLHLLLDIVYQDYGESCSGMWCKRKVLHDEEVFERLTATR
jgi:hypothetical protein